MRMEPVLECKKEKGVSIVNWSNGFSGLPSNKRLYVVEPKPVETSSPTLNSKNRKWINGQKSVILNGTKSRHSRNSDNDLKINVDDNISTSSSGSTKKPKVPDGGWGWVVVFSSFVISMIADGVSFSFGLLYIEFLNYFQESKSKTSWIGSLFMSVPLLSGPVMSALVDRYGCRKMTMLGGLISGVGFVLASFGNSLEWELIFFGLFAGVGLGLCYVTAVVSIAYWFDKYRTLAVGLGSCGTGVGTFVYAPLTQFLIEEVGWRGTVLLLAGTFLNMCVCGAVMRDPEWLTREQNKNKLKSFKNGSSCCSISDGGGFPCKDDLSIIMIKKKSAEYVLTTLVTTIEKSQTPDESDQLPTSRSVINLPTFMKQNEKVPLEVLEQLSNNKALFKVILENYPTLLHSKSLTYEEKLNQLSPEAKHIPVTMSMKLKRLKDDNCFGKSVDHSFRDFAASEDILKRQRMSNKTFPVKKSTCADSSQHHYFRDIRLHRKPCSFAGDSWLTEMNSLVAGTEREPMSYRKHNLFLSKPGIQEKQPPSRLDGRRFRLKILFKGMHAFVFLGTQSFTEKFHDNTCEGKRGSLFSTVAFLIFGSVPLVFTFFQKWYADVLELIKAMFDFSMFVDLHFLLMSLATVLLFTWFIVPYFYLAEHLTRHGYSEVEGSVLLSIIGVANCIGMIVLGWAGDQPWMNVNKTYALCLVLCGVSSISMPLLIDNYNFLALACALFGLFFASNYSFTPSILVKLIPLEKFTTAYGLILLCQGIGNLVGPPLAGWIFDITKEWDLSFYMAGVWIIIAGVLTIFIQLTKTRKLWGSSTSEKEK